MTDRRTTLTAIVLAVIAAVARLIPLQWLHPLNWDELEFYRATRWIAEGRLPFRDFWEHHPPLAWFVFAPFTLLTNSPGVDAIVLMRWVQVPVWIGVFALVNVWMRGAGLSRFARWSSIAIALASSFLMIAGIEFRVDPLGCLFYVLGLVLVQRMERSGSARTAIGAGGSFGLAALSNLRVIPLLAVTVLLLCIVRPAERAWRSRGLVAWMFAGGIVVGALTLAYLALTGSLAQAYHIVITENGVGNKYGPVAAVPGSVIHRFLVPFGVRIIASDRFFDPGAIDVGGIVMLVAGFIGVALAIRAWRRPDDFFTLAFLQLANVLIVVSMNFVYNYHFQLVLVLMIPFVAAVIEKVPRRGAVLAVVAVACAVSLFACVFRGKELDRAYQDFIMREVDARTKPGDHVWSGMIWAMRREPAYHLWFLPDMTRYLVLLGYEPPMRITDPPAAVIMDHYAIIWLTTVQRELAPFFVHHYMPVWRNLWMPAMSVRLTPARAHAQWYVPADGAYRLFASPALAKHGWFRAPFYFASYEGADATRITLRLPAPASDPQLQWWIDGKPAELGAVTNLRKGQRLAVLSSSQEPLGVMLVPGSDEVLFRQPPPGATLEAEATRVTHVPNFHVRIE